MEKIFEDRADAGRRLAEKLIKYKGMRDAVVLALPRGGVVPGYALAQNLSLPLDVLIIRKIGFPGQPEFAIGAVSETGDFVLNEGVINTYGISEEYINREIETEKKVILKRKNLFRGGKSITGLSEKTVLLTDDGVATGATIKAAILTLKSAGIEKLVLALPVAPPGPAEELKRLADEFICLIIDPYFFAVGNYYKEFEQVTDEEVADILKKYSPANT